MDFNTSSKYKVYTASQFNDVDWSNVALPSDKVRWNLAGTEFIVRFINDPHGNTITMDNTTALALMQTPEWNPWVEPEILDEGEEATF